MSTFPVQLTEIADETDAGDIDGGQAASQALDFFGEFAVPRYQPLLTFLEEECPLVFREVTGG